VACHDATYSKSGDRSGVCSYHNGYWLHVQHPKIRHRVVEEVEHLLTSWAAATHALEGPVLRALVRSPWSSLKLRLR
jgi:hypothetical protein